MVEIKENKEEYLIFSKTNLLNGLKKEQCKLLYSKSKDIFLQPNDTVIKEGEDADALYLIISGECQIYKYDENLKKNSFIGKLGRGEVIGEMGLFGEKKRLASIKSSTNTKLKQILYSDFLNIAHSDYSYSMIFLNISRNLSKRIRSDNAQIIEGMRNEINEFSKKQEIGSFYAFIIFCVCIYTLLLKIFSLVTNTSINSSPITLLITFLYCVFVYFALKTLQMPLKMFGLTKENAATAIKESILFSIPIFFIIVLAKILLIKFSPHYSQNVVFDFWTTWASCQWLGHLLTSQNVWTYSLIIYILFACSLQEFLSRGVLQSLLMQFLNQKYKIFISILVANLVFTAHHLYISNNVAIAAFLLGLYFGWLYARHRTLIGCWCAHVFLGSWMFFIVGVYPTH